MTQLRITEIFYSLQGESSSVGLPTVFIRLTGCPLRCNYCDSAYAFSGGQKHDVSEIIEKTNSYNAKYITVTGGEPLAQPGVHELLKSLCDLDYAVSLETSGALAVDAVDPRVRIVMDLKTPSSTEVEKNCYENLAVLKATDELKFVLADRADYDWAVGVCREFDLFARCQVLFSPSYQVLSNRDLADWIIEDNLPVRFQLQVHKYVWGDEPGR